MHPVPPPSFDSDPATYRKRAAEIRVRAENMTPQARDYLLEIAQVWDQMADALERHRQSEVTR